MCVFAQSPCDVKSDYKGVVRLIAASFYIWTNYSKCVIIWLNTGNLSEYEELTMETDSEKELTVTLDGGYAPSDPAFNEWIRQQCQKAEEMIERTKE